MWGNYLFWLPITQKGGNMSKVKQLERLHEVIEIQEERLSVLDELRKRPQKLSKENYLKIKEMVFKSLSLIQKEISLWEEIGDTIESDTESVIDLRITGSISEVIERLETDQDTTLDIMNRLNETVLKVQSELRKLSPFFQNVLQYNPMCNFDLSVLEIEIGSPS